MGVAPTLPGIPDSASTPTKPRRTASSTNGSHGSPEATLTEAPAQASCSTSTPRVSTRTTVPSKPASETTRLLPPPSTSTGRPATSASRTAVTRSSSVRARTSVPAGPPIRSVVRSASLSRPSATQHRLRLPQHLLAAAGHLESDLDAVVGDVLDGPADDDLHTVVVVGHHDRLGELAAELADPARPAGPGVERARGQRHRVHAVGDHPRQSHRGRDPVRPVDRVAVPARARVAHQRGTGHRVGLLGEHVPGVQRHPSSPRCTSVANAVHTGCPSASAISLRVPMMSAPPIWRSVSTVSVAVSVSPTTTGRV